VRYAASLAGAQAAEEAEIYLDHKMVIVKRRLSGLPLTVCVPTKTFRGVAVRASASDDGETVTVSIELLHADPALSVPLATADDYDNIVADWRAWAKALRLPLIVIEPDGTVAEPVSYVGVLRHDGALARRHAGTRYRRTRFMRRRKPGNKAISDIRLDKHEIIART